MAKVVNDALKNIYCEDELKLIAEALEVYADQLHETQKDLTDIDERNELYDTQIKEIHVRTILGDFKVSE
jgi:hypothetical protein